MTAQVFNLATERPIRVLAKKLADAEALAADVAEDLAGLEERLDDLGIDPRAAALLAALRCHFAWSDGIVTELDYLKALLRGSRWTT